MQGPLVALLIASLAAWGTPARAELFSSTGPVIAIFGGNLLVGEATGHLGGWGTIALHSRSIPGLKCDGEFSATEAQGDAGLLRCSDGSRAAFSFQRLTLRRGYGVGDGALSFTYGLSAQDSVPYLKLPEGKELRHDGGHLELVAAAPFPAR